MIQILVYIYSHEIIYLDIYLSTKKRLFFFGYAVPQILEAQS